MAATTIGVNALEWYRRTFHANRSEDGIGAWLLQAWPGMSRLLPRQHVGLSRRYLRGPEYLSQADQDPPSDNNSSHCPGRRSRMG